MTRSFRARLVLFGIGLTWLVGGSVAVIAYFQAAGGAPDLPRFLLAVLGITVVASALAFRVGARLARPLLRLTDEAGALAEGRCERIERDGNAAAEVGALTDALNRMIDRALERTEELGTSHDETRQALRDYHEVLALVASELRHPVSGARSKLTQIAMGYLGEVPEEMAPVLAKIARHLDDAWELAESAGSLLRAETTGFQPRDGELADVRADLVEPVVAEWKDAAADRRMEIRVEGEGGGFVLDPDLARVALSNLVGNALKYGEKGSPVDVEVERRSGALVLSVTNRGVGIAEENYGDLFTRFRRLSDPRLADRRGTGIGLFLVKRVLEAHGGDVTVEGEHGSHVTFRLVFPPGRSAAPEEEAS